MTQHGSDGLERRVRDDVQQAVAPLGLLVDDLRITRAGKRRLVRIAVDDDLAGLAPGDETTPVPPVELDTVAEATRSIDNALDASDVLGSAPYVLEVTSPGTSRPLTEPRHFRRNVGRLVTLALTDGRLVTWGDASESALKAEVLAALLTQEARVYDVSSPRTPTTRG